MAAATRTSTGDPREKSPWANKYRGATVEDLDPPPALSTSPHSPISHALMAAYERDYTHLTVLSPEDKSLLGYISIPHLQSLLKNGTVKDSDPVEKAMIKFKRKGKKYRLITMETRLEELEGFFEGEGSGEKQEFAVVTDFGRRFVLGVATKEDLVKFLERRPF
ncbi:hypothetical protein PRZ48_010134 [Zasmidium cellare]|uniref:Cystathionine beta-synthase n=1 Tax=Zasmidium cellare TaxID=395010 RepID=A0ABR0EEA5_ZASCE|nr:hypothetical protein PRZ48_010134 [Zasmidium cellare]